MKAISLHQELIQLLQNPEVQAPKYNRGHVFKSILEYARQAIGQEEALSMMYCFHLYQRILTSSQFGRLKLAKGFAQEALEFDPGFSVEAAAAGMESLKLPAVAYYNYVAGNYEVALKGIRASYLPIHQLYALGLKEAILMKIEQVTNEFRVLYAMKRTEESMHLAGELVGFVLTGLPTEVFPFGLDEVMPDDGEKDQLSKYVIDCLLFKWVGSHPLESRKVVANLTEVLAHYPDSAHYRIAGKLASLQETGSSGWESSWELRSLFRESVPSMAKILAIHFCFSYLQVQGELSEPMMDAFRRYNGEYLRLPEQITSPLVDFKTQVVS